MAHKDLNLSIPPLLTKTATAHSNAELPPVTPSQQTIPPREAATAPAPPSENTGIKLPLMIFVVVFITNLMFLMLMHLWQGSPAEPAPRTVSIAPASADPQLGEAVAALNTQIEQLQGQLIELQTATQTAQEQQADAYLNLLQQHQAILDNSPAATAIAKSATSQWFVNLGTFTSNSAATGLQKQLAVLGYQAEVLEVTLNNKAVNRVRISGFKTRESAEKTANAIMDKTDLNGLWVWKE